jgi:hypothetical protein
MDILASINFFHAYQAHAGMLHQFLNCRDNTHEVRV